MSPWGRRVVSLVPPGRLSLGIQRHLCKFASCKAIYGSGEAADVGLRWLPDQVYVRRGFCFY
jgi:hypothetical protein